MRFLAEFKEFSDLFPFLDKKALLEEVFFPLCMITLPVLGYDKSKKCAVFLERLLFISKKAFISHSLEKKAEAR